MATFPQITSPPQAFSEVVVNQLFDALSHLGAYAKDYRTTTGLTWAYFGGRWGGFSVAAGTLTLTNAATNHVVVAIASGVISVSTSSTNWDDTANYARVYKLTTLGGIVTASEDHRAGPGGVFGGTGGSGGAVIVTDLAFTSSSTTADSDPGPGVLRWNNATQASATFLYVDDVDGDGTSLATLWAGLPSGSYVRITKADDADVWQLWKLTSAPVNGTGYRKLAVALQASEGGNIATATAIRVDVDASGGTAGAGRYTKGASWDGRGSALTTPVDIVYAIAQSTGTIRAATVLGDGGSGSCVIEVWKDVFANFPPTNADKISASAPPTVSGANSSRDTTLTGWTTSVTAGDVLAFKLISVSAFTGLSITLEIE